MFNAMTKHIAGKKKITCGIEMSGAAFRTEEQWKMYTIDAAWYPRFKYILVNLFDIFEHFKAIIDGGNGHLLSTVPEGNGTVQSLSNAIDSISTTPRIFIRQKRLSEVVNIECLVKESVHGTRSRKDMVADDMDKTVLENATDFTPHSPCVTVIEVHLDTDLSFDTAILSKRNMPKGAAMMEGILFLIRPPEKISKTRLKTRRYWIATKVRKIWGPKAVTVCTRLDGPLHEAIQHQLELKACSIFRNLLDFNSNFIVRNPQTRGVGIDQKGLMAELFDSVFLDVDFSFWKALLEESGNTNIEESGNTNRPITEYIYRRLFNTVTSILACRYSIPVGIVFECLAKCKFRGEVHANHEKLEQHIQRAIEAKHQGKLLYKFRLIWKLLKKPIESVKHFIEERGKEIKALTKMEFRIKALLACSIPLLKVSKENFFLWKIPPLPTDLQSSLLKLNQVVGCGRLYGKLTILSQDEVTPSLVTAVEDVLNQHNYGHDFDIQQGSFEQTADRISSNESSQNPQISRCPQTGSRIFGARVSRRNKEEGTLGMFMYAEPRVESITRPLLYGLTAGHVVKEAGCNVGPNELGVVVHCLNENYFDIAVIRIERPGSGFCGTPECGLHLRDESGNVREIDVYTGDTEDLAGKSVYMWSSSEENSRKGIVVGNIVAFKEVSDHTAECIKELRKHDCVVIEGENQMPFSKKCNSGSVVCWYNAEDDRYEAVSVLKLLWREEGKCAYSVSVRLHRMKDKLEEESHMNFRILPFPNAHQPFSTDESMILPHRT